VAAWPDCPGVLSEDMLIEDLVCVAVDMAEQQTERVLDGATRFFDRDDL
jgi:hypothetical protein